jgi:hypothetical protein
MYYIPVYIHIRHKEAHRAHLVGKSEDEQHLLEQIECRKKTSPLNTPFLQLQAWKDHTDFNGKSRLNISPKNSHFSNGSGPKILEQMNPLLQM